MILFRAFYVLVGLTLCLIVYAYIQYKNHPPILEGLNDPNTYTEPSTGELNTRYIGIINTANIQYLKSKVDALVGLKEQVANLQIQTDGNTKAINDLGAEATTNAGDATNTDFMGSPSGGSGRAAPGSSAAPTAGSPAAAPDSPLATDSPAAAPGSPAAAPGSSVAAPGSSVAAPGSPSTLGSSPMGSSSSSSSPMGSSSSSPTGFSRSSSGSSFGGF